MHYCIPTPTTDSNTSTGMIWVTLNMPSAVEECREPSGNFTLSGELSPWDESGGIDPLTFSPMTLWVGSSGQQIMPKMIKLWDVKPCYTIRCQKMCFVLLVLLKSLHLNHDNIPVLFLLCMVYLLVLMRYGDMSLWDRHYVEVLLLLVLVAKCSDEQSR